MKVEFLFRILEGQFKCYKIIKIIKKKFLGFLSRIHEGQFKSLKIIKKNLKKK